MPHNLLHDSIDVDTGSLDATTLPCAQRSTGSIPAVKWRLVEDVFQGYGKLPVPLHVIRIHAHDVLHSQSSDQLDIFKTLTDLLRHMILFVISNRSVIISLVELTLPQVAAPQYRRVVRSRKNSLFPGRASLAAARRLTRTQDNRAPTSHCDKSESMPRTKAQSFALSLSYSNTLPDLTF